MNRGDGRRLSNSSSHKNGGTGARTSYLCRWPTWTRVTLGVGLLGLALGLAGCTYEDHARTSTTGGSGSTAAPDASTPDTGTPDTGTPDTGTSEAGTPEAGASDGVQWRDACTEHDFLDSDALLSNLRARWQFDDSGLLGLRGINLLAQPETNAPSLSPETRINGRGFSVSLNGQQFLESDITDFSTTSVTVSAWISLNREDIADAGDVIWPIVSTMSDTHPDCGYQLGLRVGTDGTSPQLVFKYGYPDSAGGACKSIEIERAIASPSWSWGPGRWWHVAGSYAHSVDTGEDRIALYSNGNPIGTTVSHSSSSERSIVNVLYVGTNGEDAKTPASAKFKGYIDDIAIFNRALTEKEISNFVVLSSTSPGPSGCRWQADEGWDFHDESTAMLSDANADGSLTLTANDQDWGYARLRAHLAPNIDLRETNIACLHTTVDSPDRTFEFGLGSSGGNGYCIWWLNDANRSSRCATQGSNQNGYEINLTEPNYCQSDNCAFSIGGVQEAWIASDWGSAQGSVSFTVRGLRLGKLQEHTIDYPSMFGGAWGPLGWCWRPQSTSPGSSATWASPPSTAVELQGSTKATVRLVADFGDDWVDISECTTVRIDASLPSECQYALVLLDAHGAQFQWALTGHPNSTTYDIPLDYDYQTGGIWTSDFEFNGNPVYTHMPRFDSRLVKTLGIQRNYESNCKVNVAITDVHFLGDAGTQGCERWH